MTTQSIDYRHIRRSLVRRLTATQEHINEDFLYDGITRKLKDAADAFVWMSHRAMPMIEEQEYQAIPVFRGDAMYASEVLKLLCVIGAMTWDPADIKEHGAIQYYPA